MTNDNMPLSVIVPIYNVKDYLEECIDSIISQTYRNLEIILVDDGSTNGEGAICDRYAAVDNRIKVIHKQNEGLVAARKSGVAAANAEYVAFVDGDDYIEPVYYERMMRCFNGCDIDLVATGIKKRYFAAKCVSDKNLITDINNRDNSNGDIIETLIQPVENGIYEKSSLIWLQQNMNSVGGHFYNPGIFPSTCTKIYRKSLLSDILEKVPNDITMGEDAAITYPYLLRCGRVVVDNDINGYVYRIMDDTMTTSFDNTYFGRISKLYEHLLPFYSDAQDAEIGTQLDLYRSYLIYLGINNIMSNVSGADIFEMGKEIVQAVRQLPIFSESERMISCDIPRSLNLYLRLIQLSAYRLFGLIWFIRNKYGK